MAPREFHPLFFKLLPLRAAHLTSRQIIYGCTQAVAEQEYHYTRYQSWQYRQPTDFTARYLSLACSLQDRPQGYGAPADMLVISGKYPANGYSVFKVH